MSKIATQNKTYHNKWKRKDYHEVAQGDGSKNWEKK
jgi:hypothetical protein